jgi:hypothetical protein
MTSRLLWMALVAALAVGCTPPMFPAVKSVAELAPDERVMIGQVVYADGDLDEWISGHYVDSWLWLSYNQYNLERPQGRKDGPSFSPRGGVFAIRAKRWPVYLDSMAVKSSEFMKNPVRWSFPLHLKFPLTDDRCVFVGTIVLSKSGGPPPKIPWFSFPGMQQSTGMRSRAQVVDTYDRDRASLATWVEGCDLQKALAEPWSDEDWNRFEKILKAEREAREAQTLVTP